MDEAPSATAAASRPFATWDRLVDLGPRAVDLLVLAAVGLCAVADVFVLVGSDRTGLRFVATVSCVLAVAVRRRFPLTAYAVVVGALLGLVSLQMVANRAIGTSEFPLLTPVAAAAGMVTTLVRRRSLPEAVAAAAAGTAALLLLLLGWPLGNEARLLLTVGFGGVFGGGVGTGIYLRVLDGRERGAAEAARRDERLDLARELHDVVAHHITGIVVQAQAAQVVGDRDPAASTAVLGRIEAAGRDALMAMRGMVGSLRDDDAPAPLAPTAGVDALADLIASTSSAGLAASLHVTDDARLAATGPTGQAAASSVYRVVQEALTNAQRHALEATRVEVHLGVEHGDLVITVFDDGRQPVGDERGRAGYGLLGMAERVQALGGTLAVGPVAPPSQGWSVQARLPLTGALP